MPTIKPVSDLENYNEVLKDIGTNEPVFLTQDGQDKYVLLDIQDYDKTNAIIKLVSNLRIAEESGTDEANWYSPSEVRSKFNL